MVLQQLHDDWNQCKRCALGSSAYRHVLWEFCEVGNNLSGPDLAWVREGPTVLLIGEGPGKSENVLGRSFIGAAGKLLRKALEEADPPTGLEGLGRGGGDGGGLSDFEFVFTNLVACRPCDGATGPNRPPTLAESAACSPRLESFIRLIEPLGIIALGKVPQDHLEQNATLDKAGWPSVGDRYLRIPHPAWVLRQGGYSSPQWPLYVAAIKDFLDNLRQYIKEEDNIR